MARLPYVDPATAPPAVAAVLAAVPPLKLFQMMAQAETAFPAVMEFSANLLTALKLDSRLRELAILHTARLTNTEYLWNQHVGIAGGLGVPTEQIQAIENGSLSGPQFSPLESHVLDFTTQVVRDFGASAESTASLAADLSPREIVELIFTIGYYVMLAQLINSTAIDSDARAGLGVVEAARDRPRG